ncbi:MAG TPA: hypothetical protein VE035_03265, partial [Puia sp.]|nr:hypothetical protein [Puia sp.]
TMDFMDDVVGDVGGALNGVADAATSAVTGIQSWLTDLGNNYVNLFNQLMTLAPAQGPDFYNFLIKNANDITIIIAHAPVAVFNDVVVGTWKALGNGLVAITLDGMNYVLYGTTAPHERRISQYEYDWANAYMFNGSLPPISRLFITNLMTTDHRFVTLPMADGTIDLNLGDAYNDPISAIRTAYPYVGQVLIHELSHSWQIDKKGVVPTVTQGIWNTFLGLAGKDRYNYYPNCKDNWSNYNLEQQASIIDAGYCQVYDNGSYFPNGKGACGTEQGFIISQVRAGVPLDKTAVDNLFFSFQSNKYILDNTRDPNTGAAGPDGIMIPSNGNRQDGAGYFMAGHKAGTFFYYSINVKVATANWGPIREKYAAAASQYSNGMFGAEHGFLGWPLNSITPINGGLFQHFQHGSIYWNPQFGAYVVEGRVLDTWAKSNWEKGPLGYPVSDFIANEAGPNIKSALSGSGYQKFERGIIRCGGIIDPNPPEIVLNSQLVKGQTLRDQAGNSNPAKSKNPPSSSVKPAPGVANSINPQPLPPKDKKIGN